MKFTFKSRALAVATACLLAMLGWYLWQQLPNRSSATVQPKVSATAVAPSALGTPQKNEQHTGVSVPTSPSTTAVATANTPPLDEASQLAKIPKGTFREVLLALEAPARSRALAKLARLQVPKEDFTSLNVSKSGDLFYACAIHGGHPLVNPTGQAAAIAPAPIPAADAAAPAAATAEPVAMAAAVPIATPPIRHSRPGAPNVLYLDFNGMTITGTRWNSDNGVASYVAKPYDTDGNPTTFSDYEQEEILKIWARVAEDYAPFNVDVTTEEPAVFSSTTGRALITHNVDENGISLPSSTFAGVAHLGVFGDSDYVSRSSPAFIYYNKVYSNTAHIADVISHELGHNLGLSHDGTQTGSEYYNGHGYYSTSWGPIMGTPYNKNISQWSKGEYYQANNFQDDMAIIASLLGYITDDAGDTQGASGELGWGDNTISQSGIITNASDLDVYRVELNAGSISVTATTYNSGQYDSRGGNADVKLELLDAGGRAVSIANSSDSPDASLSYYVPVAGTYYLRISADGAGSPFSNPPSGYTAYGSAGQYKLTGSLNARATRPPAINTQPINQMIDPGMWATLSVATKWATNYQWYAGTTGDTTNPISGATYSSYTTPSLTSTTNYWVRVSNSFGSADSATATITPLARPLITSHPASGTFVSGERVTLTVTATGATSYQWYTGTSSYISTYTTTPISGATGASYTTPPLTGTNATSYWVRVTNLRGSTDSWTATLTYVPTDTETFRWAEYKALYDDLNWAFGSNAAAFEQHWLKNGQFEGRIGRVPAYFDADAYLATYADLKAAYGSLPNGQKQVAAYKHYISSGAAEGRSPREDFRYLEYKAMYADLNAAFGSNILAYLQHWVNNGKPEGRLGRVPVNFDVNAYLNSYGDLKAAFGSLPNGQKQAAAYKHYLEAGAAEGRNFSEDFRWAEYKELHADLKAAFGNNTLSYISHWLNLGKTEARRGRVPANFDVDAYLNAYEDLKAAFGSLPTAQKRVTAFNHYLDIGAAEGRSFSDDFRWAEYKELNADLKAAFGNSVQSYVLHWLSFGKSESRRGRVPAHFDVDTYLNTYGDLKAAFGGLPTAQKRVAAFEHYLDSGAAEGRNFSEDFRWTEYKELYADLKAAFDNTTEAYLLHWLIYGKIEGRIGRRQPAFTTQPASTMSYTGASTTLSVAATYATDYQWYVGAAGDTNNPISGATGASYTTPALSSSTSYWVRISNPVGSTASATATITLAAPTLTNQPASVLIAGGTTTTLSVNSPNAVSYQWYLGTSGDTTNPISGANTVNFTTPVLNSNTSYWVKVTNPNGSTDSETTTVTVTYSPPSIITQPASVTIRPNEDTTTLAVTATAATSYQWYIGTTGDTANPISGATEANYTTPVLSSITTSYWVRVTNPIGSTNSTTAKVQISFIGMATGYAHSLFLKSNGTVWATGNNFSGELGTGDNTNRATPVQVMSGVSAVAAGYAHSLFLKSDGTVWAAGSNNFGGLGTGDTANRATPAQVMSGVIAVASGYAYSLFLKSDGTVWAAGSNGSGQLGTGDTANQMAPVQVMSGVSAIVAGESHSLFLKSDGTVWATGSNYHGQLGTGYNTNRTTPIQVLSEVVSMATSSYHSLFRKRDGTVWATGYNSYGQLGTGYLTYSLTIPMQVFSEIRAVTAGYYHSFFLNSDGTLLAAGSNYSGQLGTGDNTNRTTPIQVLSGVSEVASRYSHSLFLKSDGTIWATGSNYFGQLGTGDQTDRTTPIPVTF